MSAQKTNDSAPPIPRRALVWGAEAFADAVGISKRRAFYLLAGGKVPGARKIGGSWAVDLDLFSASFVDAS